MVMGEGTFLRERADGARPPTPARTGPRPGARAHGGGRGGEGQTERGGGPDEGPSGATRGGPHATEVDVSTGDQRNSPLHGISRPSAPCRVNRRPEGWDAGRTAPRTLTPVCVPCLTEGPPGVSGGGSTQDRGG
ncbi:hypothetical protein GCM10023082_11790 [Streptomyces tremellae]|uniref:Uncharacterized protein n=1 Tax=Streptomyces tremellae TaxID=1124239 RepID=A0ABP7EA63_9ACTN